MTTNAANCRTMDLTVCGLFAALIAVGAFLKIQIPVQPYPMNFTLQWFFVLMAGLLLGQRRAAASVCAYLVIGLAGVPVFASGGGPMYLFRPTFGFLLGFALAAWVMGFLSDRGAAASVWGMLGTSMAGLAAYYGVGILYFYGISNYVLQMPVGWGLVLINCFLLTVGEDALLCVLAVLVCRRLKGVVPWS